MAVYELLEGPLPPQVGEVLRAQLVELQPLRAHRVDHEPSRHVDQRHPLPILLQLCARGARVAAAAVARLGELALHELVDLGYDEQRHRLPLADAAHAEGALREVAEDHVLAERERGARRERAFDVNARRVDLVVEGEALVDGDAALAQLEHAARRPNQDHLLIVLVEEDHAFAPRGEPIREQQRRYPPVRQARDQRARVDERVEAWLRRGHVLQELLDIPAGWDTLGAHDSCVTQHVHHLALGAALVAAATQVEWQQVGRRAREADAPAKEHRAAQLLPRGRELEQLVLHERREDDLLEQPMDARRQLAQQPVESRHLLVVRLLEQP
mmetsp:Transcript_32089/g.84010  ORF Transcript_32089/g.84010 Transcript_32089/m.84010 type:complete len:328 (-) Transcript_32089:4091-5074(-)